MSFWKRLFGIGESAQSDIAGTKSSTPSAESDPEPKNQEDVDAHEADRGTPVDTPFPKPFAVLFRTVRGDDNDDIREAIEFVCAKYPTIPPQVFSGKLTVKTVAEINRVTLQCDQNAKLSLSSPEEFGKRFDDCERGGGRVILRCLVTDESGSGVHEIGIVWSKRNAPRVRQSVLECEPWEPLTNLESTSSQSGPTAGENSTQSPSLQSSTLPEATSKNDELALARSAAQTIEGAEQPQPKIPNKYDTSSPHFGAGMRLQYQGRFKEALAAFEAWLTKEPKNTVAWNCKGIALHGLTRLDEAIQCFEEALKILPDDPQTTGNMGRTFHAKGDYQRAADWLDKSLAALPAAGYWSLKGDCLLRLGHPEAALGCFRSARDLDPTKAEYWSNEGATNAQLGSLSDDLQC